MVARDGFVDLGTLAPPASASKFERIELRLDLGGKLMLHRMRRAQVRAQTLAVANEARFASMPPARSTGNYAAFLLKG